MQITVTFDSLEEFLKYIQAAQAPVRLPEAPKPVEKPKKAEKPAEKPQEPAEKPQDEEPAPAPAPEVPFEEDKPKKAEKKPAVTTEQIRKQLADLNKKAGENVAKMLIKQVGYKKLTDVPEGALPTLQALVEEEAAKYE